MTTWKPIETAPKDGTPILVGCWGPHYIWNQDTKKFDKAPDIWKATVVVWSTAETPAGGWNLVETGEFASSDTADLEITHWTEIPEPPPLATALSQPNTQPKLLFNTMITATEKITVYSDDGDSDHPASIEITMDATQQACPITFWQNEEAVFSMGNDELPAFIKALTLFDCSNTLIPQ